MDDFDYSVHISEQDWNSFFRECEECNLLPPVLAGMEDSGMSDMDEIAGHKAWMNPEGRVPDPERPIHSPDHEESPVDLYLSRYGMSSPLQVLSGSEEDSHMETVNVFFERLKCVSPTEDTLKQRHSSNVSSEMAGHLKESQAMEKNESIQKESSYTNIYDESTPNDLAVSTHIFTCPSPEEVIKEKDCSPEPCKEMRLKSSIGKALCCALVNGKDLISPNQGKDANSQLVIISDSDSKELLVCQGQTSSLTPRRKRKKKKRMCIEPLQLDHERAVQFHSKQSESDDDIIVRRKEMDREVRPSGDSGTVSEVASAPHHIFSPSSEIDSIFDSFPGHQQSLPGNVLEPTVACPNSPKTKSPSTITAAQNQRRLDLHEKSDLTGKLASAGQFAMPVNLTDTETGVPVKRAEPLMLQSDGSTSAPTNGDNMRSHLELNSNLPSGIKAALTASEALPASIATCDEVKVMPQAARNPGCTTNPVLLHSREMNDDCKSSAVHHTGSLQLNREALLALLPSDPEVCPQAPNSHHVKSQDGHLTVSQSDKSDVAFQSKTSASDNISCVLFPEITQESSENLSESSNNAEKKHNVTWDTYEEVPLEHRNGHNLLSQQNLSEVFDSTLVTQSGPLNVEKAQIIVDNSQKNVNVHDISPYFRSNEISDLSASKKGLHLKEVETDQLCSAADNTNERSLIQLPGQESQLKGNSQSSKIIATGDEEVKSLLPHCSSKTHELSHSAIMEDMSLPIPESMDGAQHVASDINTIGHEGNRKVHCIPPNCPSKDPEVSPSTTMTGTASHIPESIGGAEQTSLNSITTGNEEKSKMQHVPPHCPSNPELPSAIMESTTSCILESMDKADHVSSDLSTTGDEEKGDGHYVSSVCPSKDPKLPLSAKMHDMACHVPESVDGAKTIETIANSRLSLHSQSEDCTEQIVPTLRSKDITSENGIDSEDRNEGLSFKEKTRTCQLPIQITGVILESKPKDIEGNICIPHDEEKVHSVPPYCPSNDHKVAASALLKSVEYLPSQSMDGAECTVSNMTTGAEDKLNVHCIPPQLPLKEHELLPSEIMETSLSPTLAAPSPTPESVESKVAEEAEGIETLNAESQPTRPVYAISSFWNEMEKLTINDILRLRLIGQAQHPSVLLQPEDSGIADVSDAADSGYFTHLDDSKPDRSSGDMSFISDFDEELAQLQTQEAARLNEGSPESPNSENVMWESDLYPAGMGAGMEEVLCSSSDAAFSPPFYRDNAQQCFRKMCKNISVQNLQALDAQPFRKILRNASLLSLHSVHSTHSIQAEVEDDYVDPFDRVDASSPVCLSDEEEEMESSGITFSEIIQYLFGEDEPKRCASPANNIAASYLDDTGTSVPETYDHFFSEFEAGSIFNPLADDTSASTNELMPIFSCSRSANKNLQFPEVYDYFFPDDSPVHSDEDEEFDYTSIQVITRHDHMAARSHDAVAASETFEEIPPETNYNWSFLRNNPLSFRRVRRTGFTAPPEESSSWALTPVKNSGRSFQRGIQAINAMGPDEKPFPDPLLLGLENRIFRQLANQQKIQQEMQTAVADPRLDAPLMPLKQADMCLVCIAFASWVLKSANPQGADMWKAALLANISALSAIRYLRRYMRDEATRKTPLRQIEPA